MTTLSALIRLVLPALAGASLTACTATSFLTLTPARPDGPWVNGHATSLTQHPDSVQVQVGFIRHEPTALVFETEIRNNSGRPIQVAPEAFYYLMLPPDTVTERQQAKRIFESRIPAFDPEVQLRQLAARLDKQAAKATNVSWFELLTSATHIAEDAASIKKKETAEQIAERDSRHQNDDAYFEEQREQHAQQADQLYSQQQSLEATVLRKITLEPGQRAVGQVHFPRRDYARRLRLVVFFDERPVQFDFTQTGGSGK